MTTTRPPRRRLSADQRRAQIIGGVVRVVSAAGVAGASADAIAAEAGVSKGLLWHYFGSQEELLTQAAIQTAIAIREMVAHSIDMSAPAPQLIRQAMHGAAGMLDTHAAERRAVADIVSHLKQLHGPSFGAEEMAQWFTLQEQHIFGPGQRDGHLRGDLTSRALAVTYQATVEGMLDYLQDHPDIDADTFVDQVADILLAGMTPR